MKKSFIVIVIAALIVAAVWWWKKRKSSSTISSVASIVSNQTNVSSGIAGSSPGFPLKKGSSGDKVKNVQSAINYIWGNGSKILDEDGIFGNKTEGWLNEYFGRKEVSTTLYNFFIKVSNNAKKNNLTSKDLFKIFKYCVDNGYSEYINVLFEKLYDGTYGSHEAYLMSLVLGVDQSVAEQPVSQQTGGGMGYSFNTSRIY